MGVVEAVVDHLGHVVGDAGLGRLERCLTRDRLPAALDLALDRVDQGDGHEAQHGHHEDDEHEYDASLFPHGLQPGSHASGVRSETRVR